MALFSIGWQFFKNMFLINEASSSGEDNITKFIFKTVSNAVIKREWPQGMSG